MDLDRSQRWYMLLYSAIYRRSNRGEQPLPKGKSILVDLGQGLQASLDAFCEAHYGAPQVRVIREAVKIFITAQLDAEPELKKRYDVILRATIGEVGDNVTVLDLHSKTK